MFSLPAALVAMAVTGATAGETVLLDFYGDYCGPCRAMNPAVERLAAAGYPVRRINVEQYRDLAQSFRIDKIPCFVMIVNGHEAGRIVGPTSIGNLQQLCNLGFAATRARVPGNSVAAMPARTAPPASATPSESAGPVVYSAVPQQAATSDAAMLAASVRIRVEDPQGHSCGSGTIIGVLDSGDAVVLTCGHLFRDSKGEGKIDIDVYGPAPAARVPGRLVTYDLERDVALLVFRPQGPVTAARVAPPGYPLRGGDTVASVGCNNGENPTVQHSQINSLDRFLDPVSQRGGVAAGPHAPWNLQVAGQPVVGRSGGGLFSADGQVIGVCNAAEPVDHEGLFAALGSIQAALDQQGLAALYKQPAASPETAPAAYDRRSAIAAVDPFSRSRAVPPATVAGTSAAAPVAPVTPVATVSGDQAVIDAVSRRMHEGPVKVYIVPDRGNPQARSEAIVWDSPGPFTNPSAGAPSTLSRGQSPNIPTSLEVPKRPAPIYEWDAERGWLHRGTVPQ